MARTPCVKYRGVVFFQTSWRLDSERNITNWTHMIQKTVYWLIFIFFSFDYISFIHSTYAVLLLYRDHTNYHRPPSAMLEPGWACYPHHHSNVLKDYKGVYIVPWETWQEFQQFSGRYPCKFHRNLPAFIFTTGPMPDKYCITIAHLKSSMDYTETTGLRWLRP